MMAVAAMPRVLLVAPIAIGWTMLPLPAGASPAGHAWVSTIDDTTDSDHIIALLASTTGAISTAPEPAGPEVFQAGEPPPTACRAVAGDPSARPAPRAPPHATEPAGCR